MTDLLLRGTFLILCLTALSACDTSVPGSRSSVAPPSDHQQVRGGQTSGSGIRVSGVARAGISTSF